ncbi:hypothetical protein ACJX0J_031773, partial [Zea mays]
CNLNTTILVERLSLKLHMENILGNLSLVINNLHPCMMIRIVRIEILNKTIKMLKLMSIIRLKIWRLYLFIDSDSDTIWLNSFIIKINRFMYFLQVKNFVSDILCYKLSLSGNIVWERLAHFFLAHVLDLLWMIGSAAFSACHNRVLGMVDPGPTPLHGLWARIEKITLKVLMENKTSGPSNGRNIEKGEKKDMQKEQDRELENKHFR